MAKVEIDTDACIGCGACVATCPDNFEMDGDKATVKDADPEDLDCSKSAAEGCPVGCIKINE